MGYPFVQLSKVWRSGNNGKKYGKFTPISGQVGHPEQQCRSIDSNCQSLASKCDLESTSSSKTWKVFRISKMKLPINAWNLKRRHKYSNTFRIKTCWGIYIEATSRWSRPIEIKTQYLNETVTNSVKEIWPRFSHSYSFLFRQNRGVACSSCQRSNIIYLV